MQAARNFYANNRKQAQKNEGVKNFIKPIY